MATVELEIPAVPAQVRIARLVAVAAARRLALDEAVVDDLRLAVGEAAARAVALHAAECPDRPVTLILDDDAGRFAVTVRDRARPLSVPVHDPDHGTIRELLPAEQAAGLTDEGFGLAVIRGLVEDVEVQALDAGTSVRMSWPMARGTSLEATSPAGPDTADEEPGEPATPGDQRSLLDL